MKIITFSSPCIKIVFYHIFYSFSLSFTVKRCISNALNSCPDHSMCHQIITKTNEDVSECRCERDFVINDNNNNSNRTNDDYCIPIVNKKQDDDIITKTTTSQTQTKQRDNEYDWGKEPHSKLLPPEPPSSHHIIGGILFPLLIVMIFCGLYIIVKRLNVVKRVRDYYSRRQRPFYEDVIMGHDMDDPPLI